VIAKVIETVLRFLLTRLRFDTLMERTGIDKTLQRIGLRQQLNVVIPRLVYFLTLIVLARTASDALGMTAIAGAIGAFFAYLPNIIAALLLLVVALPLRSSPLTRWRRRRAIRVSISPRHWASWFRASSCLWWP